MINLPQVAKKLEDILNGVDTETIANTRNVDYEFVVATEGFHLDKIYDKETKKNFIPVFISSMGGEYNPIKGLKQADYNIPVVIYFPVSFKNDFFELNEYLVDCFVGAMLTYGTTKCLSNISIAQYGELEEYDVLKRFREWVETTYNKPLEVMEVWMSMSFNLYLSSLGSDFKYGNDGAISLTYGQNTDSNVVFDDFSLQGMSEPANQQLLDATTPESSGLPQNTAYSSGFKISKLESPGK